MGAVTIRTVARRARMLNFCLLDLLGLFGMASNANLFGTRRRQDDFAVLRRSVTAVAGLRFERRVKKRLHQFGGFRLVWVVTR